MADDDARPVLELRIHGVNNTSPASMLGLDDTDVTKVAGDKLGSFWRPAAGGRAKSAIPDEVDREAYSWGEMARSSVGGGKIVGGLARVGWALLLPFGLVNVAYWTRRFDDGPHAGSQLRATPPGPPGRLRGLATIDSRGAATLRIAGVLLTLLMAVTASTIALDLVAVQCFVGQTRVCTALPSATDFLADMGQSRRLALLSLVPVALVGALLGLSAATRVRYEQPSPENSSVEAATARYRWPIQSTDGFWSHRKITAVTARLHVAATMTLVSVSTALHVLLGYGKDCSAVNDSNPTVEGDVFSRRCLAQIDAGPRWLVELVAIGCGMAILALVLWSVAKRSDYAVDVPSVRQRVPSAWTDRYEKEYHFWSDWLPLLAAGLLFLGQLVVLASLDRTRDATVRHLVGTSATPTALLTILLALGLSALLWRKVVGAKPIHYPALIALVVVVTFGVITFVDGAGWRVAASGVAIVVVIGVLRGALRRRDTSASSPEAWNGSAPGVFLLLSVLVAMLLSSAVATAVGNWLNGDNTAASLADSQQPRDALVACTVGCSTILNSPNLEVPLPYMWFGAVCILLIFALVVIGGIAVRRSTTWSGVTPRDGRGGPPAVGVVSATGVKDSARKARKAAAIAHRAEVIVAWVTVSGTVAMLLSVALSAWGLRPLWEPGGNYPLPAVLGQSALDVGMLLLAGGGVLVIGLSAGGSLIGGTRPLGLAWDLMCFLPRAGHPLAPPCYAERVVPELSERCSVWLRGEDKTPGAPVLERRIVLSAHSLGSVLAVGVVLTNRTPQERDRISMVSYGSQLRAYFSRIFPELLGPTVLGTQQCESSSLFTGDPWQNEITEHDAAIVEMRRGDDVSQPGVYSARSVMDRLCTADGSPRWLNLWRRTDYLGFPVMGYPYNPVDLIAEDVVRVDYLAEVQTHGDYPRTATYKAAFDRLANAQS